MKKKSDPTHQYIHSRVTLQTYLAEVDRFSKWIKDQGIKMRCSEQEAAKQVPRYLRDLAQAGRSPSTIHTAAAALCKALPGTGLVMAISHTPGVPMHPRKAVRRLRACGDDLMPMRRTRNIGGWSISQRSSACVGTSIAISGGVILPTLMGTLM